MIPLLLLALAAFGAIVLYPRRQPRDWSRGYRDLRDAAIRAEVNAMIWRRLAAKAQPEAAPTSKVVSIERQRKA